MPLTTNALLLVVILGLGILIGITLDFRSNPYPVTCDYKPPPISWLQDEEGMPVAPRVTLEPKP